MDKLVGAFSGVLKSSSTPVNQPQQPQADRQYLRLPVESARKLRWFEKAELQALTKSQHREKRELLDTIAVLKKVLLRHGLEEAKLDAEVATHLRSAEELQEEHEGVASVLLAALEGHVQELRFENDRLQAAIKTAQHAAAASVSATPAASAAHREEANGGIASHSAAGAPASQALPAGAPLPRRLGPLDLAQLSGLGVKPRMDPLVRQQLAMLEAQCDQYSKQVSELKASLAKQQQQQAAARRRAPDGGMDTARAQQLQDMLLEVQEAAREEARKAARAEARATRLEGELKALQAQQRTLTKEHGALQQQMAELQSQAEAASAAAVSRAAAAVAAGEEAKAAAEAREEAASLRQTLNEVRAERATAQTCMAKLESDLQATQQREAAAVAALAEAEAVARRSDELAAANLQLSQRLAESRAELEMAAYYKKVCGELTAAKARQEDELLGLAALLSAAEVKIAGMVAKVATADEQLVAAENRARASEAAISSEVERRCGAVLSCRALWPPQLRDEVAALESRVSELEASHAAAVRRADTATLAEQELREELGAKTETLSALSEEAAAATTAAAAQLQQLRESLAEAQARSAGLQDDLTAERARSRAREEELQALTAATTSGSGSGAAGAVWIPSHGSTGSLHGTTGGGSGGGMSRPGSSGSCNGGGGGGGGGTGGGSTSTAVMTPKWQVQNKVGGGSLYNLQSDGSGGGNGGG